MVDLSNETVCLNRFGGSEKKLTLRYKNKIYMVKFPDPIREKNNDLSYINNQFSEHIGSRIFEIVGIPSQKTFLGSFTEKESGKEKIVVACEDFRKEGEHLIEFSKLMLADTDSARQRKTDLDELMQFIDSFFDESIRMHIKERFWEMFVVDAYIGNNDRHLDNFGLLEHKNGEVEMAPIYDCGSSFSPLLSDDVKKVIMQDISLFKNEEYNIPSVFKQNGHRLSYPIIFANPPESLKIAIMKIVPILQEHKRDIVALIDTVEGLSDISKEYMKMSANYRMDNILVPSMKKIIKREKKRQSIQNSR